MNKKDLKEYLDQLYFIFKAKHSSKDPVWILHEFTDSKDIEIAGLITSSYAYGQVDQINIFIRKFLKKINYKVFEFTSNYSEHKDKKYLEDLNYRFNTPDDLSLFFKNINNVLNEYGSLQNLFMEKYDQEDENILNALENFTEKLNSYSEQGTYHKYLIPLAKNRSTCKRLNLFLRWMVRKDEIDFGLWDKVDKAKLLMPVDTHVYKVSRKLKMVKRNTCDMKFAIELTNKLRKLDPEDPVRYDFAICHAGMEKVIY